MKSIPNSNSYFDFPEQNTIDIDISEYLSDNELNKYIVPFFLKEKRTFHWCGTGVIVKNFLITVAHVMMDKDTREKLSSLFFLYENKYNMIKTEDIVYDGRDSVDRDIDNTHNDLLIFKLVGINSPFVLNEKPFQSPLNVISRNYDVDGSSRLCKNKIVFQKGYRKKDKGMEQDDNREWKNCLLVTGRFRDGNSGTPIFLEKFIYGILIGYSDPATDVYEKNAHHLEKKEYFYNFLDARYISTILDQQLH